MYTSCLAPVDAENSGELLLLYVGTITQTEFSFSCKILFYIHVVLFNDYTNSYIGFVI